MPKKASKSYIPRHLKMLRPQADFLNEQLDKIDCLPADRRFLAFNVISYAHQAYKYSDGIPIPYETYKLAMPGANPFRLKELLHISNFWKGHCREYRPSDSLMMGYLGISSRMSAEELIATDMVDFVSGRRMNRPPRSKRVDDNKNSYPSLVRATIEKLTANGGGVMLGNMERHYRSLYSDIQSRSNSIDSKTRRRFANNTSCREHLLRFPMEHEGGGLYSFTPAWRTHNTGRIYSIGGCLQSASRDLKRAAYKDMPGFMNYDIKSCQPFITIILIQQAGLDAQPLIDVIQRPNYKDYYASALGISPDIAKRIIIALCMGACLPRTIKNMQERNNSILEYLADFAEDESGEIDESKLEMLLKRGREVLGSLAECLKNWHRHLLESYIPIHKKKGGKGFVLPNAVGMTLPLWELHLDRPRYRWVGVARVAAHLLQD